MDRLIVIGVLLLLVMGGCATSSGGGQGANEPSTFRKVDYQTKVWPGGAEIASEAALFVFIEHKEAIRSHYREAVERNPVLSSLVSVRLEVDVAGEPAHLHTKTPDGSDRRLAECVRTEVASWTFPKPDGGTVIIQKAYDFVIPEDPHPPE